MGKMTLVEKGWPTAKWNGAQTPADLIAEMNELICTPDKWAAAREMERMMVVAERVQGEREERARTEEPEAVRRRALIREMQ
jgi:hypothetical protein